MRNGILIIVVILFSLAVSGCGGGGKKNNAPIASFTVSSTSGTVPLIVSFDASDSSDADGSIANYAWSFGDGASGSGSTIDHTFADAGTYTVTLTVTDDDSATATATETITVIEPNKAPTATFTAVPNSGSVPLSVDFDASASSDSDGSIASYAWDFGDGETGSGVATSHTYNTAGTYTVGLAITDNDGAKGNTSETITVTGPANQAPTAAFTATPTSGDAPLNVHFNASGSSDSDGTITSYAWIFDDGHAGNGVTINHAYINAGDYSAKLTVTDNLGAKASLTVTIHVAAAPPPDPKDVAPPLSKNTTTSMHAATEFLYSGSDPIQTGVAADTIKPLRAAVLRGAVSKRDGSPLSKVVISILNHPEYGQTVSRENGMFDMAVNGGGALVVKLIKDGYLSVQRQINVPWENYVQLPDVVMVPVDDVFTNIDLNATSMQFARGSVVVDDDGSRRATLLIPPGTHAQAILPDGSTQSLSSLKVRATEYTVGETGPEAMPAELPPSSAYTYAVEYTVDEALELGANRVDFDQPLYHYVEDFIGFPVGSAVPTGYYDRKLAQWIASDNGVVIKVLNVAGGIAQLDTDGDDVADDNARYTQLNITVAERQQLASLYSNGQNLWRVPITHFTPWDCNWPYGPPPDAEPPATQNPFEENQEVAQECHLPGSIISCRNQTLGERIAITGTPYTLNYNSSRTYGNVAARQFPIQIGQENPPDTLKHMELEIFVAGRQFSQTFDRETNEIYNFEWDGKDAYGRPTLGAQRADVYLTYIYPLVYYGWPSLARQAFARFPESVAFSRPSRRYRYIRIQKSWDGMLGTFNTQGIGLGGMTLNVHHSYDPVSRILYLGSGGQYSASSLTNVIETVASETSIGREVVGKIRGFATESDGSMLMTEGVRIVRVHTDGSIENFAGSGEACTEQVLPCGDGGLAIDAALQPQGHALTIGPDGSVYFFDINRIRRIDSQGIITTVAGTGEICFDDFTAQPFCGDGGPAGAAQIHYASSIAVTNDGMIYFSNQLANRIRRIDTDGIIDTVAGNGEICFDSQAGCGDGDLASKALLRYPIDLEIGPDGSLYVADMDNRRVRRIGTDGIIYNFAGSGGAGSGFEGDGGPAIDAVFKSPSRLSMAPDGTLYILDLDHRSHLNSILRVRAVSPDGIITTHYGNGSFGFSPDGTLALDAKMHYVLDINVGQDGSLYLLVNHASFLRRVTLPLPGSKQVEFTLPSENGKELYVFNLDGRHERTLNALTGNPIYQFTYDEAGLLEEVEDRDGNVTSIEHEIDGTPKAIVSPYGWRTSLSVDASGYLNEITNPAGESVSLTYDTNGLLTTFKDANNYSTTFEYDALGRLARANDPAGGYQKLTRTNSEHGYVIVHETGMGRQRQFEVKREATGDIVFSNTHTDGTKNEIRRKPDGTIDTTSAIGMHSVLKLKPDPRFPAIGAVAESMITQTPGGLEQILSTERTVELSNASEPLSMIRQTDVRQINGRQYATEYDVENKSMTQSTPEGRQIVITLDDKDRIVSRQLVGLAAEKFTYTDRGEVAKMTRGEGADTRLYQFTYDNITGELITITDPLGREMTLAYDAASRLTSQTLPGSRFVDLTRDAVGNIDSITPPDRSAHAFTYSPLNMESSYHAPNINGVNSTTTITYNADKQIDLVQRPDGRDIEFSYDTAGKLSTLDIPAGSFGYDYDAISGELNTINSPDGISLSITMDGDLYIGEQWQGDVAGQYQRTFDNNFWVSSTRVNGIHEVTFDYDDDGLTVRAGDLNITRDVQTGLVVETSIGKITDSTTYNEFGEVDTYSATYNNGPPVILYSVDYTRDKLGRVTDKIETIAGATQDYHYAYDAAGRLSEVKQGAVVIANYDYDVNGNMLQINGQTTTYDAQDRLNSVGTTQYAYADDGALVSKTVGAEISQFTYDPLGNLRTAQLPTLPSTQLSYLIDGKNRRVGKKKNGSLVQGLLYDNQLNPIAELDGGGNVVARFVYATKFNVPDYMTKNGKTYHIISDSIGSVRLVVDIDSGSIVQRLDYYSFGEVIVGSSTNIDFQPFAFAGGIYDQDTGLIRYGARDYDPRVARWTTKDPLRFGGGDTNLYAYAANDPVNNLDPSGLSVCNGVAMAEYRNLANDYLRRANEIQFYETQINLIMDTITVLRQSSSSNSAIQQQITVLEQSINQIWSEIAGLEAELNNVVRNMNQLISACPCVHDLASEYFEVVEGP